MRLIKRDGWFKQNGWWRYWVAALGWIAGIVGGIALLVAGIVALIYYPSRSTCRAQAEQMEVNWSYGFWTECMIQLEDGRWIPMDAYRLTDEESE